MADQYFSWAAMKTAIALILAAAALPVIAQETYKCKTASGNVYQNAPCSGTVRYSDDPIKKRSSDVANYSLDDSNPIALGKRLCKDIAPKYVTWKDPESLRIGDVFGGKMTTVLIGSAPVGARQFFVSVNAKNSYGGYVGEKSLICNTSEDGRRVIGVDSLLLDSR